MKNTEIDEPRHPLTPYDLIGGEMMVRAVVMRFYDLMDEDPDYFAVRKLHPPSMDGSREKLFMFLSGWLGGPSLYEQAYGHPRLRARHMHVAIGIAERDQWMACMTRAMGDVGIEENLRQRLVASFMKTADFMRNREG
ncbi:MAG: group II truncated hemoglobin [Usitatibacteraceae bacterium]